MNSDPQSSPFDQATRPGQPPGLLAKLLALLLGAAFLVLAFMFSLVALVVVTVGGLALWGWLWWKTRRVRRELREAQSRIRPNEREVRGEAVVVRADEAPGDDPR